MMRIVVNKSTDNSKPNSICFFITISECDQKRDTLVQAALSGLSSTMAKLATQIARLVANYSGETFFLHSAAFPKRN